MKNEHPVISTFDLFEKMGYKEHRKLKEVINKYIDDFNELGFLPLEREKLNEERGRPIEAYLLNEDHFILLVLLAKNTPESVSLKIRVSKEFKRLKRVVAKLASQRIDPSHKAARLDGKEIYKQKTDVIKEFVEYATKQGSKSAHRYYGNLAKMENNAMFIFEQEFPNLREVMNIKQLMQVAIADDVVEKALKEGMEKGMHYKKEIFPLAKERVIAFAGIIGQSPILQLTN
jgi:hypothetical protein